MGKQYVVKLTVEQRADLEARYPGPLTLRQRNRVRALLLADAGDTDGEIADELGIGESTVARLRRRFTDDGLAAALAERPRCGAPAKFDGKQEAAVIALACSAAPTGHAQWTAPLTGQPHRGTGSGRVDVRVHRAADAQKNDLQPWQKRSWCIPKVSGEFVARREDVLDLYAEPHDEKRPVVCMDELCKELHGQVADPLPPTPGQPAPPAAAGDSGPAADPAPPDQSVPSVDPVPQGKPGRPAKEDDEYERKGVANVFVLLCPLLGWRHLEVTAQRGYLQFAALMKALVEVHFPHAERVRVVLDNLNTHIPGALYEAFGAEEARRIAQRLEFHYTPKHGSWSNRAELEFSVLGRQCLDRRIETAAELAEAIAAWETERNAAKTKINWTFRTADARKKLRWVYPPKPPA